MPSESAESSELNGKRKIKNKPAKRLRRKNKPIDNHTEENIPSDVPRTDRTSLLKSSNIQENTPFLLNTSSPNTDIDHKHGIASIEEPSTDYWRCCTTKALSILEKQASNRRKVLIERHQERTDSVQCILYQREQIDVLTEKNHSMSESIDALHNDLRTKDETCKILEERLHDRDELIRDNEFFRVQVKITEQKLERVTMEYSKKIDENRRQEHESSEQIQSLLDEIERIKRDLVLEEYRKQEAERKVRCYQEKIQLEQNVNKKMHHDVMQLKQELKAIHTRYDSLQIEMLAMHRANNNDISLIPTKDTEENQWSKKRLIDDDMDEHLETKRSKRKTRDRTESSASTTSNGSEKRNRITVKSSKDKEGDSNQPSLTVKRKTLKSKKTIKKHLPRLTVTHASPSSDQGPPTEKDPTQLLLPLSASATSDGSTPTTDSHDTSCESQPIQPRTKKQTRYPCRRAQRPVKQPDTSDPIN